MQFASLKFWNYVLHTYNFEEKNAICGSHCVLAISRQELSFALMVFFNEKNDIYV